MRFGLSFGALYARVEDVERLGVEAEAGGVDSLWVPDSQVLYRDPYATLTRLAGATRHVRLGTLATNALTRHPAVTANAILTIQELSGGRAILGLATGDSAVRRIGARPLRVADLERAVAEIRTLLTGGAVESEGGRFAIRWAGAAAPPVYVVATGARLLEAAGRIADGVVVNVGAHPALLRAARERIDGGARAAGRDHRAIEVVAFFFCAIDATPEVARARLKPSVSWLCQHFPGLCDTAGLPLDAGVRAELRRLAADYTRYDLVHADRWAQAVELAAFLPDAYVDAFALGGTAADVIEQVRAVQALGFDHVLIRPPSTEDWRPTVRAFLDRVIPALR